MSEPTGTEQREYSRIYTGASRLVRPGTILFDLLHRAQQSYLDWTEFLSMNLPSEMSPRDTWDLLHLLSRARGIDLPVQDFAGVRFWYLLTHELADLVADLACECRETSLLQRDLTASGSQQVVMQMRIGETVAAAMLDGLAVSERDAAMMLHLDRTPSSPVEQLVANSLAAIGELDELVAEPFSLELLEHLRELVTRDIDMARLPKATPRLGLIVLEYDDASVAAHGAEQAQAICDYANHITGDVYDSPVLRALLLADLFRAYRPLRDSNTQVGRLVFRLYTMKHGIPVLGKLPLSRTKLRWEDGIPTPPVRLDRDAYFRAAPTREDWTISDATPYMTLVAQMATSALCDLRAAVDETRRSDARLNDMLRHDPGFNYRQRAVLATALSRPDEEFRIASHRTLHGVVYATARADLLGLEEKGFLVQRKVGRAFVFVAAPGLRERIEHNNVPGVAQTKD